MISPSATYDNGILTMTFQRPRNTGDDKDWAFTDSDDGCYYFFFPVGGGLHTETDFSRHSNTPTISSQKICISKQLGAKPHSFGEVSVYTAVYPIGAWFLHRFTDNQYCSKLKLT